MLTVKKISLYGLLAVAVLAAVWSGLTYALDFLKLNHYLVYVFSVVLFMALTALLISKTGSIMIFAVLAGIMIFPIPQLGSTWIDQLAILFLPAFIYEVLLLLLRGSALTMILSTASAAAFIPVSMLLLVGQFASSMIVSTLNFSILCFILGFFAALLAVGIWEVLRTQKFIIKLRVLS